jgi:hypothetical protein
VFSRGFLWRVLSRVLWREPPNTAKSETSGPLGK